ncbi:MAG: ABC transporter ATP-binding protein [Bdellovibrionales bacterium]|nr:ABC transporter ATP-binding protein [Bdellovibrionales bacterium]
MIEVHNLTKRYGTIPAVTDLSFTLPEGEVLGLLGPNGAGKTTTMRMLTTFLAPSSGTARVCGFDVRTEAHEVRKILGYLPETPPLYPELRVEEYVRFVARIKGVAARDVTERVDEVLEKCALADVRKRLCGQLSKGYRQRIGLAGALVHRPKVVILDEPTSGLDPAQIIHVRELISSLRQQHTVVLSTHILPEVAQTCTRALIISRGRGVVEGSLEALTADQTLEERFLHTVAGENVSGAGEQPSEDAR